MKGLPGNNTPPHLDQSWEFGVFQPPVEGTVTGVFYPGDPNNPTSDAENSGTIVYQVTIETRRPYGQNVLFPVPAINHLTDVEGWDQVDPIPVGTGVFVEFTEGDRERPIISGVLWKYNSKLLKPVADQPHSEWDRRGVKTRVDKDGNAEIELASSKSLKIKDSSGNVLLEIVHTGGGYEIHLGGDSGVEKLIDARFATLYNGHSHSYVSPSGLAVTGTPSASIGAGHMTSVTRAK